MQNNLPTNDLVVEVPKPLILLGNALVISGLVITFYVASQVLQVYQAIDANPFVSHIKQLMSGSTLVEISGQSIVMGEASATTSAIALFAVLAWIGISLGASLIKAGANIVSPMFRTELATLKLKINRLTKQSKLND